MVDIATRVYNHTWKIDPIVRSVVDTDFYKLLMAQTIFRRHRDAAVTFGIKNRTARVRLAEIVDEGELREQLDHIRTLRLTRGEYWDSPSSTFVQLYGYVKSTLTGQPATDVGEQKKVSLR